MIIGRVRVQRFRKLVDQVLECAPGLNVIRGRNDAGKSTLHLVFSAALYPSKPKELASYGPWGDGQPGEITLEFEADGRTWRLQKDFQARRMVLTSGEDRVEDPRRVERLIGDLVGLPNAGLFRAALHISHGELTTLAKEQQQEIGAHLSRIVTGGDSDANRILRALGDRIRRLEIGLRNPSKTPGPLRRDADTVARLTEEQRRLAAEVAAVERDAAERDRLGAGIADLEKQVHDDDALLEANRSLYVLDGLVRGLSARVAQAKAHQDRVEAAERELASAEADPILVAPPLDADALDCLREATIRLRMLEGPEAPGCGEGVPDAASMEALGRASPEVAGRPSTIALRARLRDLVGISVAGFASAAFTAAAIGAILLWSHRAPWGVGALLFAAACAAAAIAVRAQAQASLQAQMTVRRSAELARLMEERRLMDRETTVGEIRRLLAVLGVSSVEDAFDRHERYRAAEQTRNEARRRLDLLLGERTREVVAEEYRGLLLDLAKAQAQRDDPTLALRRLDAAAYQRLQTDAGTRKEELAAARASYQRLEGRLSGRLPHDDLARVEEELAEVSARYARQHWHGQVLRLVRDVLDAAYRDTIVPGKVDLERRAGRYLSALSGEAYDRIEVDPQTLAPRVWVGPPKGWADAAEREIGSGGVDQCYLALRLALVNLLCQEHRRPPVFLDDPFLAYDEARQDSAMRFLCELSRERQIFLFTCRRVYDAYADRVFVLGDVRAPTPPPSTPAKRLSGRGTADQLKVL